MLTESEWKAILRLGDAVEAELQRHQVGLLMGGEPTYISVECPHLPEWHLQALGDHKRTVAVELLRQMAAQLAPPGAVLQYGMGKLYPGEPYPRWAFGCLWRLDNVPLWQHPRLLGSDHAGSDPCPVQSKTFIQALAQQLGINPDLAIPAWEWDQREVVGYVLPLLAVDSADEYQPLQSNTWHWASCLWTSAGIPFGEVPFVLIKSRSPMGMRLPLNDIDPPQKLAWEINAPLSALPDLIQGDAKTLPPNAVQVSLTVEVRDGILSVFIPPFASACAFVDLLACIERVAVQLDCPVRLEGYGPPWNAGIQGFQITPDPGVIEVNINPVADWRTLVEQTTTLYAIAEHCGLGTVKYGADGRVLSTGGGAHITLGGQTPQESPLLRRPDLLQSLITYWQHHPSLSYLFAGQFVGPTSQAPRVDEARHEGLYELEVAFRALEKSGAVPPPELIDQLLRPLLIDGTGNTHRAALCIDKLYPVDIPQMQLGILEFRAFEMPHTPQLRLLQLLLVRALVAWFWVCPYRQPLKHWGSALHDRFFLPHCLSEDLAAVLADLETAGYPFDLGWFEPFFQSRFPAYGTIAVPGAPSLQLTLSHALEMWPVLPEKATLSGTSRPVDDSMERLQVVLAGDRQTLAQYQVLCEGQRVPLKLTSQGNEGVGGVRFRARPLVGLDYGVIAHHATLTFEVIDTSTGTSLGGCLYQVQTEDTAVPQTLAEAEARRRSRITPLEPRPEPVPLPPLRVHPTTPMTLDLRWVS